MPVLYACSGNPGKLREFIFTAERSRAQGFEIKVLPGLAGLTPPVEDGTTYEQNAEIKALYYAGFSDGLVFADDSGLEVAALGGAPGIYSARFAGPEATGAENNALLLERRGAPRQRGARFVTAISVARAGKVLHTAVGTAEGEIFEAPRGSLGFGYDALFLFPRLDKTFAELEEGEKFGVSARGHAFRLLLDWLMAH
jgi:XTP/dITP diphosphohydrolase